MVKSEFQAILRRYIIEYFSLIFSNQTRGLIIPQCRTDFPMHFLWKMLDFWVTLDHCHDHVGYST